MITTKHRPRFDGDEAVTVVMMVLVMMMMLMMILMMPGVMTMMTVTISPSGGEFPRRNLPARDLFSLFLLLRPVAAAEKYCEASTNSFRANYKSS